MILRGEFDLAGSFKSAFGLFGNFGLIFILVVGVLIPPVKADRRFQNQENVVPGSLDFSDCLRNSVGFGEGIVDRVSQLLHEVLQWLFHRFPLMADAPEATGVPPMGSASTRSDCSGPNRGSQARPKVTIGNSVRVHYRGNSQYLPFVTMRVCGSK